MKVELMLSYLVSCDPILEYTLTHMFMNDNLHEGQEVVDGCEVVVEVDDMRNVSVRMKGEYEEDGEYYGGSYVIVAGKK